MGFPKLVHVSDTQTCVLISLCSHCFITGEISYDIFQSILNEVSSGQEILFNQDTLRDEEVEPFIEWMLIAAAKYIAADDEASLAKLRRNIQSLTPKSVGTLGCAKVETLDAAAFFEVPFPVKFAIFTVNTGLCTLMHSDRHLFSKFFEEPEGKVMQPIVLCVLVVSENHLDKTVVSPGKGACLKGVDCLPQ